MVAKSVPDTAMSAGNEVSSIRERRSDSVLTESTSSSERASHPSTPVRFAIQTRDRATYRTQLSLIDVDATGSSNGRTSRALSEDGRTPACL